METTYLLLIWCLSEWNLEPAFAYCNITILKRAWRVIFSLLMYVQMVGGFKIEKEVLKIFIPQMTAKLQIVKIWVLLFIYKHLSILMSCNLAASQG